MGTLGISVSSVATCGRSDNYRLSVSNYRLSNVQEEIKTKAQVCKQYINWAPIKTMDSKDLGELLWLLKLCIVLLIVAGKIEWCPWLHSPCCGPLLYSVPYESLPLANFNLHPFSVVNCRHPYHSFQWVLGVLLVTFQTWEWVRETLKLTIGVRDGDLLETPLKLYSWQYTAVLY